MIPGLITAVLFAAFLFGWVWAYSPKRKPGFAEAARLPLEEDVGNDPRRVAQRIEEPRP